MNDSVSKNLIKKISIRGYKSIQRLDDFPLNNLNVLIGANGSGKSNFVSYFQLLKNMLAQHLQLSSKRQGGADRILSYGVKNTSQLSSLIVFESYRYQFDLESTVDFDNSFVFSREAVFNALEAEPLWQELGSGHSEAKLSSILLEDSKMGEDLHHAIGRWRVYHFHDTSNTAGVKRSSATYDFAYLRPDASNLASFLYHLKHNSNDHYAQICKSVRLAIPFFDDFVLTPQALPTGEEQIRLLWKQKDSDYALWPSQLSDGSIRLICLVTALLQPDPPSTIIIDEPELGLHPYAITLLGGLLRSAATRMQIIVSTQSVPLVNEFSVEDLVVVEREDGATVFKRLEEDDLSGWLEDYSVGELWQKNILGGRPR